MVDGIRLVVQGDDFGMCHAVNEGVARAFTEGIVTQASAMAPCPWFDEAADIARSSGLPTGVHLTLTCEWDHLRWAPLSAAPSMYAADRTMYRTLPAARDAIAVADAVAECVAQTERVLGAGITPTHFDQHMGVVHLDAYREVCRRYGLPYIYSVIDEAVGFDTASMFVGRSVWCWTDMAARPTVRKGDSDSDGDARSPFPWMMQYLDSLTPGTHLLVCHPAEPGPELAAITGPDSAVAPWAQEYRASDLATVVAPVVRERIDELGIELTTVRDLVAV